MPNVSVSLVTYNSERYLRDFLRSLRDQTYTDWELIVVDNASSDESVSVTRSLMPHAKVIVQKQNIGFSKAHNLIIDWTASPFVLVINPDILLEPDCIVRLVGVAERLDDVAAVGAKLLRWDFENNRKTSVIDSCGLEIKRTYRITDRFQGRDDFKFEGEQVFGISGALALYRRAALDAVRLPRFNAAPAAGGTGEYFDEDFFAYKEDADLAWRLILNGWKSYLEPRAVAYHHRAVSGDRASWRDRRVRREINRYSYRNHLLMVYKNHFWSLTLVSLHAIVWFELRKWLYLLFLDGSSAKALAEVLRLFPLMRKKRSYIRSLRRISRRTMAEWLSNK